MRQKILEIIKACLITLGFILIFIGVGRMFVDIYNKMDMYMSIPMIDFFVKIWGLIMPALIYVYIRKLKNKKADIFKFNKISHKQIVLLIFLGVFIQPTGMFISYVTSFFIKNNVATYISSISKEPLYILVLSIAIMPAISEELIMRGIIKYETRHLNCYLAAILNGLLFGIMHMNLYQLFYASILGIVLYIVVDKTNSIYASMIVHFVINFTQLIASNVIMRGNEVTNIPAQTVNQNSVLMNLYAFLLILVMFIASIPLVINTIKKLDDKNIQNLT